MEINKNLIIENGIKIGEYDLIPVAETSTWWSVGRGGYQGFFIKKPVAVIIKSVSNINVFTMKGELLPKKR